MMVSCAYFLYSDGIISYAGFAALECIAISTLATFLMLLDAVSALRCNKPREKKQVQHGVARVAAGADYESEDEKP